MIRLIFLAVLISSGAWGGLSALASEGWGGGNLHLIQAEQPQIIRAQPQCTEHVVSTYIEKVKKEHGLTDEQIAVHNEPNVLANAKTLYQAEFAFDTVVLIKASGGLVVLYGFNGKICGMVIVQKPLDEKALIFLLGQPV